MISDAYTREYDQRQICKTAERLGCRAVFMHFNSTIQIELPNGSVLTEFYNLKEAIRWAEKWK